MNEPTGKVILSCGHKVESLSDGVELTLKDNDGGVLNGVFCKECAEIYKEEYGVKED